MSTPTNIEKTPWAVEFLEDSPSSFPVALRYARDSSLRVEIVHTNESGLWQWAICAASHDSDFWMDAKPTKKAALKLCKEMGWKLS